MSYNAHAALLSTAAVLLITARLALADDPAAPSIFDRRLPDERHIVVLERLVPNPLEDGTAGDPTVQTYEYAFNLVSADGAKQETLLRVGGGVSDQDNRVKPLDAALFGDTLVAVYRANRSVHAEIVRKSPDGTPTRLPPGIADIWHDSTSGMTHTVGARITGSLKEGNLEVRLDQQKNGKPFSPIHFGLGTRGIRDEWIQFDPDKRPTSQPGTAPGPAGER
jgi:hypothetical protein